MTRLCTGWLTLVVLSTCILAAAGQAAPKEGGTPNARNLPSDFPVIELRRYTVREGERQHFADYFEAYFPQAIQQLGAIVAGEFLERDHSNGFTWIRGFHSMDQRAIANAGLYYGSVWKEHKATMNGLMTDSDNVLLLRPLRADSGVMVLPAVDPVKEASGAQGVVVAQIFQVTGNVEEFAKKAEATFVGYRGAGIREAGVLVTLDATNNFPQLPVRSDGPFLVWLGIAKDNEMVEQQFMPLAKEAGRSLAATGQLKGTPELLVMDPAKRSRMRWLAEPQQAASRRETRDSHAALHL